MIPATVLAEPAPDRDDAQRELVRVAARALGIGTARDLCGKPSGYVQLSKVEAVARVAELVDGGELVPVRVEGWDSSEPVFVWHETREPARVDARALLSPFDPLMWSRDRIHALFGFRYRIGIYTRQADRTTGYHVLPFLLVLLGERLVGRVDLRSDRAGPALLVQAAHGEPDVRAVDVVGELAAEPQLLARWLALDRVVVTGNGDLSRELSRVAGA